MTFNLKYLKYISKNQKVDQIVSYCVSSICYEKSIRDDLIHFENNLELILENNNIESDNNINYESLIKNI